MHTSSTLEALLQRHGDNLYRLALLLSPDTRAAEALLLRVVRHLLTLPAIPTEQATLVQILRDQLPAERRATRTIPAWAKHPQHERLLLALARLPYAQRVALASDAILEPTAVPTEQHHADRQAALLALAPPAGFADLPTRLFDPAAPEECQIARRALAHNDPTLHDDPTVRGHLALCDDCRAIAQDWQQLAITIADLLRATFRQSLLPEPVRQQLLAAAQPNTAPWYQRVLASPWLGRAIVPVIVLAVIAVLVWPRSETPSLTPTANTGAAVLDLPSLVQQAQADLYTQPTSGLWHTRYTLRWTFADGSYAPLAGDIWSDRSTGQTRIQLTHAAGGGPFEFGLADGKNTFWYATSALYGETIYPFVFNQQRSRVQLALSPADQQRAITARLRAGAWALPEAYLRQAAHAKLQNWGRQAAADGTELQVIGFEGTSALVGQPDALDGPGQPLTILLSLSPSDGRLYEIRELLGPAGGDQVSRTVWSWVDREQIANEAIAIRIFQPATAWNGIGELPEIATRNSQPLLPLIEPAEQISPAAMIDAPRTSGIEFPATRPPGVEAATFLQRPNRTEVVVYIGTGRSLTILAEPASLENQASFSTAGPIEQATIAGRPTLIRRMSAESYALLLRPPPTGDRQALLSVQSYGYSRDELLATLQGLGPLTPSRYRDQIDLFVTSASDPRAQAALLNALVAEPVPAPGQVRYTVATTYLRQNNQADPLSDPYHLPPYGGRPAELVYERWQANPVGALIQDSSPITTNSQLTELFSRTTNATGKLFDRSYIGPSESWFYRAPEQTLVRLGVNPNQADPARSVVLRMLSCGGHLTETTSGRTVTYTEEQWDSTACVHTNYPRLIQAQQSNRRIADPRQGFLDGPYLADLLNPATSPAITTFIQLGDGDRVTTIETRLGTSPTGTLIESWRRERDTIIPVAQIPADVIHPPTNILFELRIGRPAFQPPVVFRPIPLAQALAFTGSSLLAPAGTDTTWYAASTPVGRGQQLVAAENPFQDALWRGRAVQLEFAFRNSSGVTETLQLYQGNARAFGEVLRARAAWQSSAPTGVVIGDRAIPGWQVQTPSGIWILFRFNETLVAFPENPTIRAAIQSFAPLVSK